MLTVKDTINREFRGSRYSYIELYDIDTDALIYKGVAWDCPYSTTCIVKDCHTYNMDNKVCFTMWVDFASWETENDYIIIPYDEIAEIHNTPLGEMTHSEFIEWVENFDRH